ncbi:MAG: HtaA domain-containing protein [Caulobacteraceae bacterium]
MPESPKSARVATLLWGVKQSFRSYVEGAGGAIEVGEGAERAADGVFAFAAVEGEGLTLDAAGKPQGAGRFRGAVRFQAHGGMLSVYLADPAVQATESGASLTVAEGATRERRVELARLDLAGSARGEHGELVVPAVLAPDGWRVLGDHYPTGTPLDPVRLRLGRG